MQKEGFVTIKKCQWRLRRQDIPKILRNFAARDKLGNMMTCIRIKNMVCPRCINAVRNLLQQQHHLTLLSVTLGEAVVAEEIAPDLKASIAADLVADGFELLDNPRIAAVESIKTAVIEWVRCNDTRSRLSQWLSTRLAKDYSALSRLFTEVCGITIERYCILQRIEYAKELMCYSEQTLSEIAWTLGYSSPAHLSSQFKQATGMSPREFRILHGKNPSESRRSIDEL